MAVVAVPFILNLVLYVSALPNLVLKYLKVDLKNAAPYCNAPALYS